MKVYRLYETGPDWLHRLATGLEESEESAILVVPNANVAELASNVRKRMGIVGVRIMTTQVYQRLQQEAGEDLSAFEVPL